MDQYPQHHWNWWPALELHILWKGQDTNQILETRGGAVHFFQGVNLIKKIKNKNKILSLASSISQKFGSPDHKKGSSISSLQKNNLEEKYIKS